MSEWTHADRQMCGKPIDLMARTSGPTQADILLNENSILAAKSQRILQSLLGPPTNGAQAKTKEELEEEDAGVFKPEPDELLGPGFSIAENAGPLPGTLNVRLPRADEKLRKQMLGNKTKRTIPGVTSNFRTANTVKTNANVPTKPRPATANPNAESDEEEGRSLLGKTKRRKTERATLVKVKGNKDEEGEQATDSEVAQTSEVAKMKPSSYLDEILSARAKKKKKKTQRSGQHEDAKMA